MSALKPGFLPDKYTRKARLAPAFLVALPVALVVYSWFPNQSTQLGILWSMLALGGGTVLLAQVARKPGKAKEPGLFDRWGGKPTTEALRHRGSLSDGQHDRFHRRLSNLFPDMDLPTEEEERGNPEEADERYDHVVSLLRSRTRDKDAFPLVFEENCNYGFRRNVWGLKPYGLSISVFSVIAIGGKMLGQYYGLIPGAPSVLDAICSVICIGLAMIWIFLVTPSWVKIPAIEYRDRLFEAVERI